MRRILIALALIAALSVSAAYGRSGPKPQAASVGCDPAPVATVTVTATEIVAVFGNLTPGDRYGATIEVWGENDPYPYWRGGYETAVRGDGTFTVREDLAELAYWQPEPERVVIWLRPTHSPTYETSTDAAGRPLRVEQTLNPDNY